MKHREKRAHPVRAGLLTGLVAFIVMSLIAGGMVEFSRDAGWMAWLRDFGSYFILNKFFSKLLGSVLCGCGGFFVSSMVAYGKNEKIRRKARAARVQFMHENGRMGRIA